MKTQKGSIIRPCWDGSVKPARKARVANMTWRVTKVSPDGHARAYPVTGDNDEAIFFKSWVLVTP